MDGERPRGRITTEAELRQAVHEIVGIDIPDVAICPQHVSPFRAFADAFFARHPVVVWKASRGFGGKSVMLAALSFLEAIDLQVAVNLLGGSGEQSQRVHSYITGEDTNLPDTFWKNPRAPLHMLITEPTKRESRLVGGGRLKVLMASTRSVRGPHPVRLRIDEVDEIEEGIYYASQGQTMEVRGVREQTVLSSTHHYANGTMTKVLQEAAEKGWPVYQWCWRESVANGAGWLNLEQVERKRANVSRVVWDVEYDLQEPNPQARAIDPDKIERMFSRTLGVFAGEIDQYIEIEAPVKGARYVHGADWARKVDFTVIVTLRIDVYPYRLVAFERTHKRPWPVMVAKLDERLQRYGGAAAHDATGLGDVITGYLLSEPEAVIMQGRGRTALLSNYVTGIEQGDIIAPYIEVMHGEHLYASVDDLYSSARTAHLPDTIAAGALAYSQINKARAGDWNQVADLGHIEDYPDTSLWR